MTNPIPVPAVLVITDPPPVPRTIEDAVLQTLDAGCRWIMYREKEASAENFRLVAKILADLCLSYGSVLSINGDIQVAREVCAGGVHLQSTDEIGLARTALQSGAPVGVSCHSIAEAQCAELAGADYVTLSPIFETASKPGYGPALGLGGLGEATECLTIPVIALAGISSNNAADCIHHGAQGVAVMGGVMRASDIEVEVKGLISALA